MDTGKTIGHYTILRQLGKGGMGEVYLADDTKLDRQVAIKVLPDAVRSDPERLARFRREAKAAASLKHNNIATIHSIEEADKVLFIVMEYVDFKCGQYINNKGPQSHNDNASDGACGFNNTQFLSIYRSYVRFVDGFYSVAMSWNIPFSFSSSHLPPHLDLQVRVLITHHASGDGLSIA